MEISLVATRGLVAFLQSAIDFPDVAEAARKSRAAEFATGLRAWEGGGGRQIPGL